MSTNAAEKPPKGRFLDAYKQEHATTLKVLGAFPAGQHAFKPHEKSNSALRVGYGSE